MFLNQKVHWPYYSSVQQFFNIILIHFVNYFKHEILLNYCNGKKSLVYSKIWQIHKYNLWKEIKFWDIIYVSKDLRCISWPISSSYRPQRIKDNKKKEIEFKHNFRRLKRYELYFLEFYIGAKTCLYDIYFEQIINFCQMKDFSSKDK